MKNYILISILGIGTLCGSRSFAYENPISKFTFDTGYLQDSARGFWSFGQNVDGAVSTGFDAISSTFIGDFALTRIALGGLFYWQWNRLEYGFFVANHELGHGARFRSLHLDPIYAWEDEAWQSNIFSFWAKGFTRYGHGAYTTVAADGSAEYAPDDYLFYISAGGMNNSALYAEFIEDQVFYHGGGHLLQYLGYVRAKQDAAAYVNNTNGGQEGDVLAVVEMYAARGYDISANDLRTGSLVSRWASSTHWLFVASALKYAIKGDPSVNGFYIGPIKAPDVSHFLTGRGISYKVRSGLRTQSAYLPLSVEYVYKGESVAEVGLGYRTRGNGLGLEFSANSKAGYGASADYTLGIGKALELAAGASYYSGNSLMGERVIAKYLSGGEAGYEVWAKIAVNY